MASIFAADIFTKGILPFLLVFTLIFAILERTKILGEGKKQINAIIAFVVGLLLIAFAYPTGVITKLVPFMAVMAVIILVFLLLYGFIASDKDGLKLGNGVKIAGGIIIVVALAGAVLWATGSLDYFWDNLNTENIWGNILLVVAIVGAMALALGTSGKSS